MTVVPLPRAPGPDNTEKKETAVRQGEMGGPDTPNKKTRIDNGDAPVHIGELATEETPVEPPLTTETLITNTSAKITPPHLKTQPIVETGTKEAQVQQVATPGLALDYGTESEEGE